MENPTGKDRLLLKHQLCPLFRCEDNNVAFTDVQPHLYRVRQVEPCHQVGWSIQAIFSSNINKNIRAYHIGFKWVYKEKNKAKYNQ